MRSNGSKPDDSVGLRIERFRRDLGLSQKELALLVDVTPQTVSNWERSRHPPEKKIGALAAALGRTPNEILGAAEPRELSPAEEMELVQTVRRQLAALGRA